MTRGSRTSGRRLPFVRRPACGLESGGRGWGGGDGGGGGVDGGDVVGLVHGEGGYRRAAQE